MLKTNPNIGPKEVTSILAKKGVEVSHALFYFVKCQMKGRKSRMTRAQKVVTKVANFKHGTRTDAETTILKVKACATEVGGMKNLKALVEALSD